MKEFLTHPATVYALIGYLWRIEKDEAEKAEGAAKFFEDKSAELIKIMDRHKEELKHAADMITGLDVTNKSLRDTNAHLSDILSRAYVRNFKTKTQWPD
jgi:hypothetical protein